MFSRLFLELILRHGLRDSSKSVTVAGVLAVTHLLTMYRGAGGESLSISSLDDMAAVVAF